ncbi:hypothetical protein M426DRAFT_316978 [Hypoxylon sp. CI-4A]|nr:hypothetical protein M426DRAFT_316978 [Hypoxylon sp. CI-4A]
MSESELDVAALSIDREQSGFHGLEMGEQPQKDMQFCPWKLLRAYPYVNYDEFVVEYFNEMLFEARTWDFYCLLDPGKNGRDPLLLVPSSQFEDYLKSFDFLLQEQLLIPRNDARLKFFVTFGEWDTPLPRFLGCADSEEAIDELKLQIHRLPKDDLTSLSADVIQGYRDKMDWVYMSFKSNKRKKDPSVAKRQKMERHKGYGRMVKRTQRYLGLRSQAIYPSVPSTSMEGWTVDKPPPFKPNDSVRFVCVDVEAWERGTRVVTEVGFAVLDTEDIVNVPPGTDGHDWFPLIKSFHYRIEEHMDKVNHRYVEGCPDAFHFGISQVVRSREICKVIGSIIGDNTSNNSRPVVMVGHDISQDLSYLQKVGFTVWRVNHFLDEVDTKSMFQRLQRSVNGRGLKTVCEELGIPGRNFHNAGNDATYTLRAMIVIAVKQLLESPKAKKENSEEEVEYVLITF